MKLTVEYNGTYEGGKIARTINDNIDECINPLISHTKYGGHVSSSEVAKILYALKGLLKVEIV